MGSFCCAVDRAFIASVIKTLLLIFKTKNAGIMRNLTFFLTFLLFDPTLKPFTDVSIKWMLRERKKLQYAPIGSDVFLITVHAIMNARHTSTLCARYAGKYFKCVNFVIVM